MGSNLIEKLKEKQGTKSQGQFAAEIGITQATLSRISTGAKAIGLETAKAIVKACPDLADDVWIYFFDGDIPSEQEAMATKQEVA